MQEAAKPRTNPIRFFREVKQEASKVTWPSRRETIMTTVVVIIMVIIMSIFFLLADKLVAYLVRFILTF